jgi:hypothetical protein
MASASSRAAISGAPLRSAPAAKMNGLPVNSDRGDVGAGRHRVQRVAQRHQPGRAERARPGVVAPVVQRDERHRASPVGQFHVAHQRPGDDFLREQRGEKRRVSH